MATVTVLFEVNSTFDLEVIQDSIAGTGTFKIIKTSDSSVMLQGNVSNLKDLVNAVQDWQRFKPVNIKSYSKV